MNGCQSRPIRESFKRVLRGEGGSGVVVLAILGSGLLHALGLLLAGQFERDISLATGGAQVEFDVVELIDSAGLSSRELVSPEATRATAQVEPEDVKPTTERRAVEDTRERDVETAFGENAGSRDQKRLGSRRRRSGPSFTVPSGSSKVQEPVMVDQGQRGSSSLLSMRGPSSTTRDMAGGLNIRDQAALNAAIERPRRGVIERPKPEKGKDHRGPGRRIGEYTFYPEANGKLTYRDPQKDYLAVLMPNGDIEFETRFPVTGGICALGVCVQVGGLRGKSEPRRKRLNRVRLRFAPVPLGVGGNFGSLRGIDDRKLQLMRATFQARLEMRVNYAQRLLRKELRGVHEELEHILFTQTRSQARRLIIARALEIDVRDPDFGNSDARTEKLLRPLFEQKKAGARAMCQKILGFVQRHAGLGERAVFVRADIDVVARHCRSIEP